MIYNSLYSKTINIPFNIPIYTNLNELQLKISLNFNIIYGEKNE